MVTLFFIAKLVISSGLLYGYYHLFLRNQRFHRYNRFYLLAISLISIIIPFIHIPVNFFRANGQHSTLIQTLKVINADWEEPVIIYASQGNFTKWINIESSLYFIYIAGAVAGFFILVRSLAWIKTLKRKYPHQTIDQLKIYSTAEPGTPFSFFRSIFWDEKISLDDNQGQQIFRHELFHVKEKHSADILLLEILCCACWFNPFYHLIKKEIRAIHEFLADEYAVSVNNRYEYAELLVLHAINLKTPAVSHPFFHTQIKRRIIMITQSNLVRHSGYISRMMVLPLLFLLVSAFAVKLSQKTVKSLHFSATKNITVVIDPGHGGTFPGANNIGMLEKDINLGISQKIKQLAGEYNVNVVLTRNDDKLVGNASNLKEDLLNRVKISDEAKPNLFISIHVNQASEKNSVLTGFEAYISKRKINEKTKQFASVILGELKNIYATDESIKQRDEGIIVIDRETYPSILLECGYLNNPKDLAFITDPDNQEKIARKILEGIVKYQQAQTTFENTNNAIETTQSDFISAETLSKMNADDVKSINADLKQTTGTVFLKNGSKKYFNIKDVNDYYTANHIDGPLKGFLINVNMQDSVVDIIFNKDSIPAKSVSKDNIPSKVEVEAAYPGGKDAWASYLFKSLQYPADAVSKKIQGTVVIEFIVDQNGKISGVKAVSGPQALRAESMRVIKESGDWTSAVDKGKKVKSYKKLPISYKLS